MSLPFGNNDPLRSRQRQDRDLKGSKHIIPPHPRPPFTDLLPFLQPPRRAFHLCVTLPTPFDLLYSDRWSKCFYYQMWDLTGCRPTALSLTVLIIFKWKNRSEGAQASVGNLQIFPKAVPKGPLSQVTSLSWLDAACCGCILMISVAK